MDFLFGRKDTVQHTRTRVVGPAKHVDVPLKTAKRTRSYLGGSSIREIEEADADMNFQEELADVSKLMGGERSEEKQRSTRDD